MSISIRSPFSISAIGPPTAASGETCPMAPPRVAPEKRPSVINATDSDNPRPASAAVGASISRFDLADQNADACFFLGFKNDCAPEELHHRRSDPSRFDHCTLRGKIA